MDGISFEWDARKAVSNKKKHGISFDEAKTVFFDENARLILDPDENDDGEERFVIMGLSDSLQILVVCHCYRKEDDIIRLISARKATRIESAQYRGY